MNVHGSYRKLLENSRQAILAAIEIYNKPNFGYREEIFSILLINAWELIILAILSKNKVRIFEKKNRNAHYKTLRFEEAIRSAEKYFPKGMEKNAVIENISLLREYRNLATHYYNKAQDKQVIYALSQASIKNYRDLLKENFDTDIAEEVNLVLLPLSFTEPPDFVHFLQGVKKSDYSPLIADLLVKLEESDSNENFDTNRLVTRCAVKIDYTGNIEHADIIATRDTNSSADVIVKSVNPDHSHPFYQKDIIGTSPASKHKKLEHEINSNDFQAIVWKWKKKEDDDCCWVSKKGGSPRYSQNIISFINSLTVKQIKDAKSEYNNRPRKSDKEKDTQ